MLRTRRLGIAVFAVVMIPLLLASSPPPSQAIDVRAVMASAGAAPSRLSSDNYDLPTSPCFRARQQGPVTNFLGVRSRWRHCSWLVYPSNITGFCAKSTNNSCPKMTDVRWSRWQHNKAVGKGWFLPADRPNSKYRARVVFSSPQLLYTRTGRTWGLTRTRVDRLGGLQPRTILDQRLSYAFFTEEGMSQCAVIKRGFRSDAVSWVVINRRGSHGGFSRAYPTWNGSRISAAWHRGRLSGFGSKGPRVAIRARATDQHITLESRNGRTSQPMRQVSLQRWQEVCPLD